MQFLDYMLERLPFRVEAIQTDNGAEFQSGFHWHVLDRGIRHTCIKPATPRLNGKVERFHKTLRGEFLTGKVFESIADAQTQIDGWVRHYNYQRRHQGIGDVVPWDRFALVVEDRPTESKQATKAKPQTPSRAKTETPAQAAATRKGLRVGQDQLRGRALSRRGVARW